MIDADYELAARLQAQEQEELTIEERSKMFVDLMDKRKKHFASLRAEEQRRKPPTKYNTPCFSARPKEVVSDKREMRLMLLRPQHVRKKKSYLLDYEEIYSGFVAFEGDLKGVSHKCVTRKTMFFLLTLNVVLSPDFKLLDENHVFLRVPRKDNMYNVELKNIVPSGGIENLIDLNMKVIRCDNGNEFKNKVMNQFFEMKGIKRKFSIARTPQQNGVAERKNRTLIEAARTMLVDSKLPTTFWAEAVNTVCYVQNRVLVIKPQNKTPYELFLGRKPALSFMRPFRVFNSRTRIVEENLHVKFSKATPNIAGSGPNWLFDIDALTKSMNYEPVVAGNQSNGNADPSFSSNSKDSPDAGFKALGEEEKIDTKNPENENSAVPNTEEPRVNQEQEIVGVILKDWLY
ncbi:retrovirus-related pol polyprotein from transposon TNT 1-94 [Tanacetum coccineum]